MENLEWATLLKEDTSFVTKKLKKYFSDLLYSCEVKGKIRLKIAFLFEHKSFPVDFPEFQISAYYQRVWEECDNKKEKRIIVVPIIFYHGKESWVVRELHEYFGKIDDYLKDFVPKFKYILIDISKLDDVDIKKIKLPSLQIAMFLMRYIFDKEKLQDKIAEFLNLDNFIGDATKEYEATTIIEYLHNNLNDKEMDTVLEKVESKLTEKNIFLELYRKRIENIGRKEFQKGIEKGIVKGFEKGIEKGIDADQKEIAKKMILKGYDNQFIKSLLDLTDKEIDKLREEIAKS